MTNFQFTIFNFQPISSSQLKAVKVILVMVLIVIGFVSMNGLQIVNAQVMSSRSYKMQSDSMNFAGGRSDSATYVMEDTAGEIGTGISASPNHVLSAGYQQTNIFGTTSTSTPPITPTSTPPTPPAILPISQTSGSFMHISTTTLNQQIQNIIEQASTSQATKNKIIPVNWVASSSSPFLNVPMAQNIDPRIAALTLNDFDFIQDGKYLTVAPDGTIDIDGRKNLTVRLDYNKVPEILKTVAFTLADPSDPSKVFPFVLRVNDDKSAYEATIGALGKSGDYKASVVILDYQNQGLKKLNGDLMASIGAFSPSLLAKYGNIGWLILLFIILLILTMMLIVELMNSKKHDENSNTPNVNAAMIFLIITVATLITVVFDGVSIAKADFNKEINYQGKLMTSTSTPVADGTYNVRFALYTTPIGGTAVWNETTTAQVNSGLFSVLLGDVTPFTGVNFNQTLYLGVEIGGIGAPVWDGEMSPRKMLGAVPAAFIADIANSAEIASTSDYSTNSGTSTYSTAANYSNTSGTSTYALNAGNASTANTSDDSLNAATSSYALNAATSTYASIAGSALNSSTSTFAFNAATSTYADNSGTLQGFLASQFIRSDVPNFANLVINGSGNFTGNILSANITATGTLSVNSIVATSTSAGALTTNTASIGTLSGLLFGTNGSVGTISTSSLAINTDNLVQGISNLFYNNSLVQTFLDTINKGYFFSTSSADVWDATKNRWATSSSDVWLTTKTTDNLAQGSTNKYFTPSLFASTLAGTTTDALAQGVTNKYYSNSLFASSLAGTTTTALPEGTNLYYTDARARNAISSSATGLLYSTSTGIFSLDPNYNIPLTASTTNWNSVINNLGTLSTLNSINNSNWSGTALSSSNGGTGTSTVLANNLLIGNNTGTGWTQISTSSLGITTNPAGSNGQLQFNNNGVFGATTTFSYSTSTNTLHLNGYVDFENDLNTGAGLIISPSFSQIQSQAYDVGGGNDNQGSQIIAEPANNISGGSITLNNGSAYNGGIGSFIDMTGGYSNGNGGSINMGAGTYMGSGKTGNVTIQYGNFGIGTTTPDHLLSVDGSALITGTTTSPCFSNNGTTCITSGTNYWTSSGSNLYNNTGTMLGINTNSPPAYLSVQGAPTTNPVFDIRFSSNPYALMTVYSPTGNYGDGGCGEEAEYDMPDYNHSLVTTSCASMVWTSTDPMDLDSPVLGIDNASPIFSLDVNGDIGDSATGDYDIGQSGNNTYFNAVSGGFVGIGTASPSTVLDVNGDITNENVKNCNGGSGGIGTDSNGKEYCETTFSDARLKDDITSLDAQGSLDLVNSLNPVSFYWKDPTIPGTNSTQEQFGFLAQDVEKVAPNLVATTSPTYLTPDGTYYLNYQGVIPLLAKAIQGQQIQINTATSSLSSLSVNQSSFASSTTVTLSSLSTQFNTLSSDITAIQSSVSNLQSSVASTSLTISTSTIRAKINEIVTDTASRVASSTVLGMATSTSFIQTIAAAVQNVIASTGNWVVDKFTAHIAYVDRLEAQTVAISKGLEMADQVTGQIYCVTITNGDFNRRIGGCDTSATSTLAMVPATSTQVLAVPTISTLAVVPSVPNNPVTTDVSSTTIATTTVPVSITASTIASSTISSPTIVVASSTTTTISAVSTSTTSNVSNPTPSNVVPTPPDSSTTPIVTAPAVTPAESSPVVAPIPTVMPAAPEVVSTSVSTSTPTP